MSCRAVHACVRSGCLMELNRKSRCLHFPFPFRDAELSFFPFGGDELSVFPSPNPQTSYSTLVGFIGVRRKLPERSNPSDRSQAKDATRKLFNDIFQANFIMRELPNDKSKGKYPKIISMSDTFQADMSKRTCSSKISKTTFSNCAHVSNFVAFEVQDRGRIRT